MAIVLSLIVCGILLSQIYQKWNENPIILSFADRPTHISDIPFPAITICPRFKKHVSLHNAIKETLDAHKSSGAVTSQE